MAYIDKVKLEQIIDSYLQHEIPLAFLMEQYKLTYPQIKLLLNRTTSYTKKTDSLYDSYPNSSYDNVSQDYIAIPHEVAEEYPFSNDEQIALFKRLEELKDSVPIVSADIIRMIDEEISRCQNDLQAVNMEEIAKAEKVAKEIANMRANDEGFEDIFRRNYLTPEDFKNLNQAYSSYMQLLETYNILREKKVEAEKELKTAKKLNREIEDIRESLVVHNMKLVNFCTRYFFNGMLLPQDEVQLYGMEGLAKAINGFDYKLGYQFSSYAVPTIVHTIERYFKEMIGLDWVDFCRKEFIRYNREWYRKEIGIGSFELSARELAESGLVPLTEKQIANNDALIDRVVPLSDVQEPFEDEAEYGRRKFPATFEEYDSLDDYADAYENGVESIGKEFNHVDANATILEVLKTIPVRNAQVLILRFGLEDGKERTLPEIARIFHVTQERIRQIEAKGLRLLRYPTRAKKLRGLAEYLDEAKTATSLDELPPIEGSKRLR